MNKHKKVHDLTVIQRAKCDSCSKTYKSVTAFNSLKEHQKRTHFDLFPEFELLNCQKCGFKTKSFTAFNEHKQIHESEENCYLFKSDENCLKSYAKKQSLNEHKRTTHLGIVYKCDFENCEKVFRDKRLCKQYFYWKRE